MGHRVFVLFLLIALTGGCTATPKPEPGATPASATPAKPAKSPQPEVQPDPEPETPPPALASLFGLNGDGIMRALGAPALKRLDPPAELWQYRGPSCVLALYLYAQPKTGATVIHIEAHDHDAKRIEPEPCFHALLHDRG